MTGECPRAGEIERAHATGRWPPELADHGVACATCREAVSVLRCLKSLADTAGGLAGPPPSAGAVFARSRLMAPLQRERETVARASWPLRAAEVAAVGITLSAVVVLTGLACGSADPVLPPWSLAGTPAVLLTIALVAARLWVEREG